MSDELDGDLSLGIQASLESINMSDEIDGDLSLGIQASLESASARDHLECKEFDAVDKLYNKDGRVEVVANPCKNGQCGYEVASMIDESLGTPENARLILVTEKEYCSN